MFSKTMQATRSRVFSLLGVALMLLALVAPSFAAAVPYPIVITDTSGVRVAGAAFTIGGVALTPGTPATITVGKNLTTGATISSASVTEVELSNGAYSIIYDAALTGEAYFPLTVTKGGSTIAAVYDMICSQDSTTIASALTTSTSNGTSITAVSTKLGTPVGATISADIAGIPSTSNFTGALATALTNIGLSATNAAKVLAFANSLNATNGAVVLPTTPPTGYGGAGGGGAPFVHR